jgi:hypothetical protein
MALKEGSPDNVRKVFRSQVIDFNGLYEFLYRVLIDSEEKIFKNDGAVILLLGEAARWNSQAVNKEINFMKFVFDALSAGAL